MSDETKLEIGDRVTWRKTPNSLALTGCVVLALGKTEDGQEAVTLQVFDQEVNALASELHRES